MSKKANCAKCGSQNLKSRIITYPVQMKDKTIEVGRVSVRECLDCSKITPTEKGQEKINHTMMAMMNFFGLDT